MTTPLVTIHWLKEHREDKNLILLDASQEYDENNTIKGAVHFDIKNTFSNTKSPYPNTFPSEKQFEEECRKLGITRDSQIVVFDSKGIFTSTRVWWMFTVMGHKTVAVLDGGLPAWNGAGFESLEIHKPKDTSTSFKVHKNEAVIYHYDQIVDNCNTQEYQLIDARSQGRFNGTAPEPRAHLQSGHIKNALNLPYTQVLSNGYYKPKEELEKLFKDLHIDKRPIIFSCGSGITACIILLAFTLVSDQESYVYDGSWTEWAERNKLYTQV